MKFNGEYRSLVNLIDDLVGSMPKLNEQTPLDRNSAVEWAVDCLRQIGGANYAYVEDIQHFKVDNNVITLPKTVMQISGVYKSSHEGLVNSIKSATGLLALKYAGGINSVLLCHNCVNKRTNNRESFSIRFPNLVFNFTDAYVCIVFNAFKVDEFGIPMYPDDPSVSEALKAYILWKWMYESFILGDIDGNRFEYIKSQKDYYVAQAKNNFSMPDKLESRGIIENVNHRYDKFNIPR